jgi:hypothetical protein
MNDTIKIGDTVVRRVRDRDSFWKNSCDKHKWPVDGHYVVVGFNGAGGIRLQGFHSDYAFTETCFDLVEFTPEQEYKVAKKHLVGLTPEEEYKVAKKLIGKTVKFQSGSTKFKVEKVILRHDDDGDDLSFASRDYLKKHGYVVAVISSGFTKPFPEIELVPDEITLKLNDSYDAIVTKDGIKVGCQTFSHDIVEKLKKAIEQINK